MITKQFLSWQELKCKYNILTGDIMGWFSEDNYTCSECCYLDICNVSDKMYWCEKRKERVLLLLVVTWKKKKINGWSVTTKNSEWQACV